MCANPLAHAALPCGPADLSPLAWAPIRSKTHQLIGAINWAGVVPNAHRTGVRNDRCGFGWGASASLHNFGTSFGTPCSSMPCPGFFPPCDLEGAVLPFPYGTGAGYIFSAAVLRWLAQDAEIIRWVKAAAGDSRNRLQWQKYEDTSTGYWLSYAPFQIEYMNIGRWVHDHVYAHVGDANAHCHSGSGTSTLGIRANVSQARTVGQELTLACLCAQVPQEWRS